MHKLTIFRKPINAKINYIAGTHELARSHPHSIGASGLLNSIPGNFYTAQSAIAISLRVHRLRVCMECMAGTEEPLCYERTHNQQLENGFVLCKRLAYIGT